MTPTKEEMILKIEKTIGFQDDMTCDCNQMADKVCYGCSFSAGYNSRKNHVRVGDVFDWYKSKKEVIMEVIEDNKHYPPTYKFVYTDLDWVNIHSMWIYPRKPIQEQSDDCINFIYSLIKQGQ